MFSNVSNLVTYKMNVSEVFHNFTYTLSILYTKLYHDLCTKAYYHNFTRLKKNPTQIMMTFFILLLITCENDQRIQNYINVVSEKPVRYMCLIIKSIL